MYVNVCSSRCTQGLVEEVEVNPGCRTTVEPDDRTKRSSHLHTTTGVVEKLGPTGPKYHTDSEDSHAPETKVAHLRYYVEVERNSSRIEH